MADALQLLDPRGLTFTQWAAYTSESLARYNVPRAPVEEAWREWAAAVIGTPGLVERGLADPREFSAWADWAATFIQTMES